MSAKQRTKNRIRQRLVEKLNNLSSQEDTLHSVIKTYVDEARTKAEEVLAVVDTEQFLQLYGELEQHLDRTFSTCELLTATAEDMIEEQTTDDVEQPHEVVEDSTLVDSAGKLLTSCMQSQGNISQAILPRTSTPDYKLPDDVVKRELQGIIEKGRFDIGHGVGMEGAGMCQKQVEHSLADEPVIKQMNVSVSQDVSGIKQKSRENSAASAQTKVTAKPEQKHPDKKQSSADMKKSNMRNISKNVPRCVKKNLKNYDSGFEASSQISEQEQFVKGLQSSSSDTKSSPKTKQKSPKKKKGKKNKAVGDPKDDGVFREEIQDTGSKLAETGDENFDSVKKETDERNVGSVTDEQIEAADKVCTGTSTEPQTNNNSAVDNTLAHTTEDLTDTSAVWKDSDIDSLSFCQGVVQPLMNQEVTPVVVSEIISPWCFFVQPNGPQLKQLMTEICGYMTSIGVLEPHLEAPTVGTVCLARFTSDKAFYRAAVTKLYTSGAGLPSHVDVLYLDYGNKEKVKVTELRRLPQTFKALPPQAACCSLAEVMPSNRYCVWTEEDIFNFKHFVCNQQLNCIRACNSSMHSIPHLVKLIGNYPTPSIISRQYVLQPVSIGQFLINRGSAKYMDITEQIRHLIKTEEGKEEATILNGTLTARTGPKIRELDDSVALTTVLGENLRENIACDGNDTNTQQETLKQDNTTEKGDTVHVTEIGQETSVLNSSWRDSNADSSVPSESKKSDLDHEPHCGENRPPTVGPLETGAREVKQGTVAREIDKPPVVSAGGLAKEPAKSKKISSSESLDTVQTETSSATTDKDQSNKPTFHGKDTDMSDESTFQMLALKSELSTNPQGQEVMLAHVKSPGHFYVHLVSKEVGQALDDLMKHLNQQFEKMNRRKLSNISRTFKPTVNTLCCAKFTHDNNFYRASIKSLCKPDGPTHGDTAVDKVLVHYVDFGDEEWVSRHRVYPLPPELTSVPPLATRCSLVFIKPKSAGDGEDHSWSESSTETFTSLAGFEKTLHMHIVQGSLSADKVSSSNTGHGDCVLGVLLVDNTGIEEVCINLELIRNGQAELDTSPGRDRTGGVEQLDVLDVWNPMEDDYMSKRNSYRIDVDDAGVATTGYKAQDETRLCKFFSRGQRCWRGDLCPYRHVTVDSGVSLDQEQVYALGGNQDQLLPAVHSWVALEVTTILTPGRFYAHLPLGKKSLDVTTSESDDPEDSLGGRICNETLDDLLTALNAEYNTRPSFQGTSILKAAGEIVAARFSQDQHWYRARVIQVTEDKLKVFFVDFGNTEWLPEDEVAEMKPEFLHLPFQALECFLYRVEPSGQQDTWSREAQSYFRELVDAKTLVGHVHSSSWNHCLTVELFDTTTDKDVNIGDLLVESGHAMKSTLPTESSCNVSKPGSSRRSSVSTASVILVPG